VANILVTGGAGFLGSHLCERLLAQGNRVLCVDDLSTGRYENIKRLADNPQFSFIRQDIVDPLPGLDRVDQVYNLASAASPAKYQADPIKTLQTNTTGVWNLLALARGMGAVFFQASTSEVYGDPSVTPQRESYWGNVNPIGVRSCYDEGKRVAEAICMAYHRQYGLPVKIVRIFNTYGPRMAETDGRVVSNLITQALRGEELTIYGDGTQTRSFCYVDDLIDGFILMMGTEREFVGPVNLGNPDEYNLLELADKIRQLTGCRSSIRFLPLPEDDPKKRRPDITLAREKLRWEPKVSLSQGLLETIRYFAETIKRDRADRD